MINSDTGRFDAPPREPDEAPCTPEQAVELARHCPGEKFEKLRTLGTWQAGKMIADIQRAEQQLGKDAIRAAEEYAKRRNPPPDIIEVFFSLIGLIGKLILGIFLLYLLFRF